ncbi:crotonase/enoyl-CoA hydratase family protein [Nocardioides sp. TF02-7]|uniref:crotonase/enoyl-CoA hydratase family protein n=1 Tax=Nocardioides sp. TF02-7 TaxID=2917724 RepID=UPI001F0649D8|nr:crotonase/enoyl-CoA hydratase family protein [Nocardioides sp. TF02-7]UMG93717.1 crotonase/enoyl-CoA hydratase family protein [Nocardioides sp. TF02-7]
MLGTGRQPARRRWSVVKWLADPCDIRLRTEGPVAYITIDKPEKRNAMSLGTLTELRDAMLECDDRKAVRCVVLEGAGKDFCSGADMTPVGEDLPYDPADYRAFDTVEDDLWQVRLRSELRLAIFRMHKPVIAKVQGNCLAAGTDVAFNCDLVVAADDARFGFPAARSLGSPANHMWLYLVGPQWAKRLLLTGDVVDGRTAARLGLALESHPAAELGERVDELAQRIALMDPALAAAHKRVVNAGLELMGWDVLQRMAADTDVRAHQSAANKEFIATASSEGFRAAVHRRDAPYGASEVVLRD